MSQHYIPLPGSPVNVPLPPQLAEAFGYPGQARYVGMNEQRQAMARMVPWLDQCPSPPGARSERGR
jgi:hypothetical protein